MVPEERAVRVAAMNVREHGAMDPEWRGRAYFDLLNGKKITISSLRTHLIGDSFASVFGYLRINPSQYEELRKRIFVEMKRDETAKKEEDKDSPSEGRCKDV